MARATRTASKAKTKNPILAPKADRSTNYLSQVISELQKVSWPERDELVRMTGVVIVTVLIFGTIIGIIDFGLAWFVSHVLYRSSTG